MQMLRDLFHRLRDLFVSYLPEPIDAGIVVEPADTEEVTQHTLYTAMVAEAGWVAYLQFGPELVDKVAAEEEILSVCPFQMTHTYTEAADGGVVSTWSIEPVGDVASRLYMASETGRQARAEAAYHEYETSRPFDDLED